MLHLTTTKSSKIDSFRIWQLVFTVSNQNPNSTFLSKLQDRKNDNCADVKGVENQFHLHNES